MSLLTLPRRLRKSREHQFPDLPRESLSLTEAIAALDGEPRPAPTFTPAALRETTPVPVLAEAQQAWTAPLEFTTAPGALRAAVKALRGEGIAGPGANPYPEPHDDTVITEAIRVLPPEPPAPAAAPRPQAVPRHRGRPSPAAVLRADRDDLPVFRGTARSLGWRALLPAPAACGWVRYTTDRWAAGVAAEINRSVSLARAELAGRAAEFTEMERRRAEAADAALFPVRHQ